MAEDHADEDRHLSGYQLLIGELKARVAKLEEALTASNTQHASCLEKQMILTAQVAKLETQVEALWRHDQVNKKHAENIEQMVKERLPPGDSGPMPVVKTGGP